MAVTASIAGEHFLVLSLAINDPGVAAELKTQDDGRPRNSFSVSALKISFLQQIWGVWTRRH
jgi:hypothetical protein